MKMYIYAVMIFQRHICFSWGLPLKTYSEERDLEPVSLLSLRVIKYTDNWHVLSPKHM